MYIQVLTDTDQTALAYQSMPPAHTHKTHYKCKCIRKSARDCVCLAKVGVCMMSVGRLKHTHTHTHTHTATHAMIPSAVKHTHMHAQTRTHAAL